MKVKTIEKDGVKITIHRQYMVMLESPNSKHTRSGINTLSEAEQEAEEMYENYTGFKYNNEAGKQKTSKEER